MEEVKDVEVSHLYFRELHASFFALLGRLANELATFSVWVALRKTSKVAYLSILSLLSFLLSQATAQVPLDAIFCPTV